MRSVRLLARFWKGLAVPHLAPSEIIARHRDQDHFFGPLLGSTAGSPVPPFSEDARLDSPLRDNRCLSDASSPCSWLHLRVIAHGVLLRNDVGFYGGPTFALQTDLTMGGQSGAPISDEGPTWSIDAVELLTGKWPTQRDRPRDIPLCLIRLRLALRLCGSAAL